MVSSWVVKEPRKKGKPMKFTGKISQCDVRATPDISPWFFSFSISQYSGDKLDDRIDSDPTANLFA
jgi:hypothetical protein